MLEFVGFIGFIELLELLGLLGLLELIGVFKVLRWRGVAVRPSESKMFIILKVSNRVDKLKPVKIVVCGEFEIERVLIGSQ